MNYRDKFYKKYISTHTNRLYGAPTLEFLKKEFPVFRSYFKHFLPPKNDIKILDLACGNGGFLYWLRQIGYSYVEGVDSSAEQVELAEKLGIDRVYEADAVEFLSSKKEKYDIVFARDFFEHLNKNELLEISEIILDSLGKDGILIVQTANAETLFGARLLYSDMTHEIAFTKTSIEQLLLVAGFSSVKAYPMRPVVHGFFSFVRYCVFRMMETFLHVALLVATGYKKGIFTQCILCVAKK